MPDVILIPGDDPCIAIDTPFPVACLFVGHYWSDPALTYSFPAASDYESPYISTEPSTWASISSGEKNLIREVFAKYAAVSGLTFTEETVDPGSATIRVSKYGGTPSHTYFPDTETYAGDVWLQNSTITRSNYMYSTTIHEIGHALGLKHPHATGSYNINLPAMDSSIDALQYSVMSYRSIPGGAITGYTNENFGYPTSLMPYDVFALQYLYGPNATSRSGQKIYSWAPSTGAFSIDGSVQSAYTPFANRVFMVPWTTDGADHYVDVTNYSPVPTVLSTTPGGYSKLSDAQLAKLNAAPTYAPGCVANPYFLQGQDSVQIKGFRIVAATTPDSDPDTPEGRDKIYVTT